MKKIPALAVLLLAPLFAGNALGGCTEDEEIPVKVDLQRNRCWAYSGIGTTFETQLARGQSVYVRIANAEGILHPEVHGPDKFYVWDESLSADEGGEIEFQAKTAGRYDISFTPCAAWGEEIKVEVCTK